MKSNLTLTALLGTILSLSVNIGTAAEAGDKPATEEINKICPISGKPVDPKVTWVYEGKTYAFAVPACRAKWRDA